MQHRAMHVQRTRSFARSLVQCTSMARSNVLRSFTSKRVVKCAALGYAWADDKEYCEEETIGILTAHSIELSKFAAKTAVMCAAQGYAWAEDKEHCEEYGRMLDADPKAISQRAKKRGLPQVHSLLPCRTS